MIVPKYILRPAAWLLAACALRFAAEAQEVPRPSLIRQEKPTAPTDYNLKVGQVMLTADATVYGEFIDNVYLRNANTESDFVVRPEFGLNAAWQVTQLNVLRLRTSVSYTKYLDHPDLDSESLNLAPNSALSFSVFVGDVKIEFHDQFSLQNDTLSEGAPGGIARLPRFTNTVGVSLLWDMNDIMWSLGYDHYNFITLGSGVSNDGQQVDDLSRLDHSTDQAAVSVVARINDAMSLGLEGTVAYSQYPNEPTSDYTSFSVGPFTEVQVSHYTSLSLSGGFKGYSFEAGPPVLAQVDSRGTIAVVPGREAGIATGFYADLTLRHRLNRFYSDRLQVGHEDQADALSGRTESNYLRYSASWNVNLNWTLNFGLYFEDVQASSVGGIQGALDSDYLYWGGQVSTGYKLTEHMNVSLSYQFTRKDADDEAQSYTQNRVALGIGYKF